jgi:hypothetical protein
MRCETRITVDTAAVNLFVTFDEASAAGRRPASSIRANPPCLSDSAE